MGTAGGFQAFLLCNYVHKTELFDKLLVLFLNNNSHCLTKVSSKQKPCLPCCIMLSGFQSYHLPLLKHSYCVTEKVVLGIWDVSICGGK